MKPIIRKPRFKVNGVILIAQRDYRRSLLRSAMLGFAIWAAAGVSLAAPATPDNPEDASRGAVVYLYRLNRMVGMAVTTKVTVDNQNALLLSNNGCATLYLAPGNHHIEYSWYDPMHLLLAATYRSGPASFDAPFKAGDKLYFKMILEFADSRQPNTVASRIRLVPAPESSANEEMEKCKPLRVNKPFDSPVSFAARDKDAGAPALLSKVDPPQAIQPPPGGDRPAAKPAAHTRVIALRKLPDGSVEEIREILPQ